MEKLIINEDNLNDEEINRIVIRSKALIINSNYMCLLGFSHGVYQFIGGHLDENETLEECLKREVKEEVGIDIPLQKMEPFFVIEYYCKDYPDKGINTKYIANYFEVKTDLKPDLNNINLTEDEIDGNFEYRYIPIHKLESVLLDNLTDTSLSNVVRDTLEATRAYIRKNNNIIREKSCGAIIVKNNKVLVVKQQSGFYGFPKGHIENDETEIESAIREVKEETNIDIKINNKYRYKLEYEIGENVIKESVFYLAEPLNLDVIKQEGEISEISWIDFGEAYDILTFDNAKEMWLKAKEDIKNENSYLGVFDENNNLLDEKVKRGDKFNLEHGKKFKIVLIYIKNSEGKYLIQKCSKEKGGVFATTGGHVDYGNNSIDTARIEIEEELGIFIKNEELKLLKSYFYDKAIFDVYLLEKDIDINEIVLQKEEVESVCWMSIEEIKDLIDKDLFRKGNIESFNELILK